MRIGAISSREPMQSNDIAIATLSRIAATGSPFHSHCNGFKTGMRLSSASAWMTRLALWMEASAEDVVEAITPIVTITDVPVPG